MTKRTVVFGIPMYVVRRQVLPLVIVCCALVVFYVVVLELSIDRLTDFIIANRNSGIWLVMLFAFVSFLPVAYSLWIKIQMSRYTKRMKRLKGRACFVCNYEIAEGLDRCSECGAVWSLDDLNRGWRKRVEGTKG